MLFVIVRIDPAVARFFISRIASADPMAVFFLPGRIRKVQIDENYVFTDLLHLFKIDKNIVIARSEPRKSVLTPGHHNAADNSLGINEHKIAYAPEASSVRYIDHFPFSQFTI